MWYIIVFAYLGGLIRPQTMLLYQYKLTLGCLSIVFLYLFVIVSKFRNIKQQESTEEIIKEDIEKAKEEVLFEQQVVNELYKNVQKHTVKIVESKLKILIEERQIRAKIAAFFLPIIALGLVIILINILGIPIISLAINYFMAR